MRQRTIVVNGKMQKGYHYARSAPIGRNFDPEFIEIVSFFSAHILCAK